MRATYLLDEGPMAGRSPQPTKVQRDVEPSKGVVQSSRFVKSAALGITGGTSVKNDALIKGEQEKSRRARRSCTASRTLLCQSAPSGDAPETMDARDVRQNRVGPAFCVCEGDHGRWANRPSGPDGCQQVGPSSRLPLRPLRRVGRSATRASARHDPRRGSSGPRHGPCRSLPLVCRSSVDGHR